MRNRITGGLCALVLCAALALPAGAKGATVEINGVPLDATEGWVEGGTSYVTLSGLCRVVQEYELGWDGSRAKLAGRGVELTARPGDLYIQSNDRALYLPSGVRVAAGRTALPAQVVIQALGGQVQWDGATATARLTLGRTQPQKGEYGAEDLYWLSRIIYAESGGEPLLGQIAVGNVVLNRVKSSQYPNTIKGVVFDTQYGTQFEPVSNGTVYNDPSDTSVLAAKLALEGADVVGHSLYFFAPALSQGTWIVNNRTYHKTIGCHQFYL